MLGSRLTVSYRVEGCPQLFTIGIVGQKFAHGYMSMGVPDIGDDIIFSYWQDREHIDLPVTDVVWWWVSLATLIIVIIIIISPLVVVVVVALLVSSIIIPSLVHSLRVSREPTFPGEVSVLVTVLTLKVSFILLRAVTVIIAVVIVVSRGIILR